MSDIRNMNVQGNITISPNSNTADNGIGILFTDFLGEASTSSGVSVIDSGLYINDSGVSSILKLINDVSEETIFELNSSTNNSNGDYKSFRVVNESGDTLLQSKGNKGIKINKDTGNILIDSLADAINSNTASIVSQGGLAIGKSVLIQKEISALDGIHVLTNTVSTENVLNITNTSSGGYSSINFKNSAASVKLDIGYGNGTALSPLNDMAYIQSKNGSQLLFRGDNTDSFKISTNASLDFYSSLASTSNSTGSLRLLGGIGISNTTDAVSITNGGTFTTGGGMAIAKKLYVGGDTRIEGDLTVVGAINGGGGGGTSDHGALTGLADDDHSQYVLLAGRSGGQIIIGGISASDNLTIRSTSDATKGSIIIDETTASSSSSTGAVVISGGIGISNTTEAISSTNGGSFTTAGGLAVAKKLYVGGYSNFGDRMFTTIAGTAGIVAQTWLQPALSATGNCSIQLGVSQTQYNDTFINFNNVGTGNSANYSQIGLYDGGGTLDILGTGQVRVSTNIASTSSTTGALTTIGGISSSNTTDATSATNGGTFTTAGGMGIAKKLFVGTDLSIGANITSGVWNAGVITATYGGTGAATLTANAVLLGNGTGVIQSPSTITYATSTLTLPKLVSNDSTSSTSNSTGAVIISGGVAISNTTDATSITNGGTFTTAGGMAIAKKLYVGDSTTLNSHLDIVHITPPSSPSAGVSRVYLDSSDSLLKSKNSSGDVKIYNPLSTKGDILSHDGSVDVRVPTGVNNQVLYANSALSSGVGWKNLSTDTNNSNPASTKYFEAYNTSSQSITGTYTPITVDATRLIDTDFFTKIDDHTVKVLVTGLYTIIGRITTTTISGNDDNNQCSVILAIDDTFDSYSTVPGTICYTVNADAGDGTSTVAFSCILSITENQKIQIRCKQDLGTNALATLNNGCNLIISRPGIDDTDNSKFFNGYVDATTVLTGSLADIDINVNRVINSSYTHAVDTPGITFNDNAKYIIFCNVGFSKTSGNDVSCTESVLLLSDNAGLNFTVVDASVMHTFHDDNGMFSSASSHLILDIVSGQILKLQSRVISGSNIRMESDCTQISIINLGSTSLGQATPKFMDLYDTGTGAINLSYTDLTYDTNRIIDSVYSHTVSTSDVQVSEAGKYLILAKISIERTATNNDSTSRLRMMVDNGNGFAELAGSLSSNYHHASSSGKMTLQTVSMLTLSTNSKIKCQILKISGSGTLNVIANSSELSMVKFDPEAVTIESILIFGTFYKYIESLGSTVTTSTSYIQKLRMTTDYLPDGYYRVGVFYNLSNSSNNGEMGARLQIDDITTVEENSFAIQANNTSNPKVFYTPIQIQLSEGIHTIDLDFKNISGITTISGVKLESWRVI